MIKDLKEKDIYFRNFLINNKKWESEEGWEFGTVYNVNMINICNEYKKKFNSDLIKDLSEFFKIGKV